MKGHLHGLIQLAKQQAEELHHRIQARPDGNIWHMGQWGWIKSGYLASAEDREDLLVGKLTQEER